MLLTSILAAAVLGGAAPTLTAAAATTATVQPETEVLLSGSFQGHQRKQGRGTAKIIRENGELFLEFEDFRTSRGPQLVVWVAEGPVTNADEAAAAQYVLVGDLQSPRQSSQRYALPSGFDLSAAASVVIWCEPFSVVFASADLS